MSVIQAIILAREIASVGSDVIDFTRTVLEKAKATPDWQVRRIAFSEALAAFDRAVIRQKYASNDEPAPASKPPDSVA